MAVCKARDLAHYIVDKCTRDDEPVSNLQLQKMLYLIQFVHCGSYGEPLFDDEDFQAWRYGPVLPDIYHEYSQYGGRAITEIYDDVDRSSFKGRADFVDSGIEALREWSPWELVDVAHAKGSPWDLVWRDGRGRNEIISNEMILDASRKQ